jgi:glutaredoxin-like protein
MPTKLLNEDIARQVQEVFDQLQQPVQVLFFGKEDGCDYCDDTRQLVEEVVSLSDKLGLSIYDVDQDAELARRFNVDKAPGLVLAGRNEDQLLDFGVRYAGIPAGHEFGALIHDILLVSSRDSGLDQSTRDYLKGLTKPMRLQVFVTPT